METLQFQPGKNTPGLRPGFWQQELQQRSVAARDRSAAEPVEVPVESPSDLVRIQLEIGGDRDGRQPGKAEVGMPEFAVAVFHADAEVVPECVLKPAPE